MVSTRHHEHEQLRSLSPTHRTQYGTSSLEGDDALRSSSSDRRRHVVKWATTALVVSAGAALLALSASGTDQAAVKTASTSSTLRTNAVAARQVAKDSTIECWQSSYINSEKKMMEPIPTGLEWKKKKTMDGTTSFIAVDVDKKFQEILGFGGAFTEAAALQFSKLPPAKQEEVLTLYFDKDEGSGYEFGRVPMGSSDYGLASYSFNDVANDTTMRHFDTNVTHDRQLVIPFIQRALEKNPKLKMFLAPWSPPAWMKRASATYTPSMLGTALPIGLKDEAQPAWALYFSKFISAYKTHGIHFWGLTPQNEPEFSPPWEACGYTASYQADFIANHLGPVIKRDHPELKIMVFDHNRGSVRQWAETIFRHPNANQYVDGIAFHWYNYERYMDGVEFHERLNDTHYVDESRFMLATESCNCPELGGPAVANGSEAWFRGQRYAHDIIMDMNNWVVGWVDWNLLLDHRGGPNHLGNYCDAPIILDETETSYFLQPMYYFIQHFSRFVPSGSRRIHTDVAATFTKSGDAQLFVRYPAVLHTCDNSARQAIHVTEDSKLQVTGSPFCLDLVEREWIGYQVELVECQYTTQTWTFKDGRIRMHDQCLTLNHGSTANGARVAIESCAGADATSRHHKWHFENGTMQSVASPKCVTAGYSFVQSVGFVTPENKKVLVVLNENTEDADFELQVGDDVLETTIPRGAIRTYTWE